MNNTFTAAVAALMLTATAAAAQDLTFFTEAEYAFEAETFSTEVGMNAGFGDFVLTPAISLDNADGDYDFVSAELQLGYYITETAMVYARVETDEDFHYSEAVVGARFEF